MAYVKFSQSLKDEIHVELKKALTKRYRLLVAPLNPILEGHKLREELQNCCIEKFEEKIWGEYIHLKDMLPTAWKNELTTVPFRVGYKGIAEDYGHDDFHVESKRKLFIPPKTSVYGLNSTLLNYTDFSPEIQTAFLEFKKAEKAHMLYSTQVTDDINKIIKTYASLNEALKHFPDLALYCPQHRLDKVAEVVNRGAAAKAVAPIINSDIMTSLAVINKLN